MVHDRRQPRLSDVIIIITRTCPPGTVRRQRRRRASECRRLRYVMCAVATDLDYAAARRRRPVRYMCTNIPIYVSIWFLNVRSSGAQIASETCHFPCTGAYIPVAVSSTTTATTTALHINLPIPIRAYIYILCRQTCALNIMYGKNEIVPIYYVHRYARA